MSPVISTVAIDQNAPGVLMLSNVRIAYADGLNTARVMKGQPGQTSQNPTYSCALLISNESTDAINTIRAAMWRLAEATFGQSASAIWQEMEASGKLALKNGATKASQDGFLGHMFFSPNAKQEKPPLLLHKFADPEKTDGSPLILKRPQGIIYSGCYVNAQINLWVQNNDFGRRINSEVLAVQFANDGDRFGGGASANISAFSAAPAPAGMAQATGFGGAPAPAPAAPAAPGAPGAPVQQAVPQGFPPQMAAPGMPAQQAAPQGFPQQQPAGFPGAVPGNFPQGAMPPGQPAPGAMPQGFPAGFPQQ